MPSLLALNGDESFELEVMTSKSGFGYLQYRSSSQMAQLSKLNCRIADVVSAILCCGYLNHFLQDLVLLASNTSRRRILDHAFSVNGDLPLVLCLLRRRQRLRVQHLAWALWYFTARGTYSKPCLKSEPPIIDKTGTLTEGDIRM